MEAKSLKLVPEPLKEPVHGRVILQEKAIPIKGDDPSIKLTCGKCNAPLIVGLNPRSFRFMFNDAEILIRCNTCKSYNDATPEPPGPYDLDSDLLDHIKSLLSHALNSRNELFLKYQAMGLQDPRISIAGHLLDVASGAFLNLNHVKDNLRHVEWWKTKGFNEAVEAGIVPSLLQNYMAMNTGSLMFFSFSLFESGLRRIVRAIDTKACSGGSAEFKSIYEWLFARLRKSGWSYSAGDPSTYLDLFRVFRNTLHNNGAYYPPNGRDQIIEWNKVAYEFKYGTVPNFYGWEFHIMLLSELVTLNHSIMLSDIVANLPSLQ